VSGRIAIKLNVENSSKQKSDSKEIILESKIMLRLNPDFSGQMKESIKEKWQKGTGILAINAQSQIFFMMDQLGLKDPNIYSFSNSALLLGGS